MSDWLLLTYKIPSEPSAKRVYVWRKLKSLGAILVHDAVWVLPALQHTREKFQWLAGEINEIAGGEAVVWEVNEMFTGNSLELVSSFQKQVESLYEELLVKLLDPSADLQALARQYQQTLAIDYFQSPLAEKVREAFQQYRGGKS